MEYNKSLYLGKKILLSDKSIAEIENVDDLGFIIKVIAGGPYTSSLKTGKRYFYSHYQLSFTFVESEKEAK